MSDIVFCRTWMMVEIKKYYNLITSLLGDVVVGGGGREDGYRGMKPKAQL